MPQALPTERHYTQPAAWDELLERVRFQPRPGGHDLELVVLLKELKRLDPAIPFKGNLDGGKVKWRDAAYDAIKRRLGLTRLQVWPSKAVHGKGKCAKVIPGWEMVRAHLGALPPPRTR